MPRIKLQDAEGKDFRSFEVLSDDKTVALKHVLFKYFASMEQAEKCLVRSELGFVENSEAAWLVYRSGVDGKLFHAKLES